MDTHRTSNRTPAIPHEKQMDVLLPIAREQQSQAMRERLEGTFRLNLQPHHAMWMLLIFVLTIGTAQAQAPKELISPIEALIKWMPFILWGQEGTLNGFALNLMISFFAMLFGTIAGVALGLMQISLLLPVRRGSWIVTQFFRNSPWLVLLFTIMLLFPFEIDLGYVIIPVPDWMKAVIGFALPVMANISEVVRGAVRSLPTGQWE